MNDNLVFEIEIEKDGTIELPQEVLDILGVGVGAVLDIVQVGSDAFTLCKNNGER